MYYDVDSVLPFFVYYDVDSVLPFFCVLRCGFRPTLFVYNDVDSVLPFLCPMRWILSRAPCDADSVLPYFVSYNADSLLLHLCPVTIDSQQVVRINILIPPPLPFPPPPFFACPAGKAFFLGRFRPNAVKRAARPVQPQFTSDIPGGLLGKQMATCPR